MSPHGESHERRPERGSKHPTYPESLGSRSRGQVLARDRGNGLKTSLVYRWTNGAGWVQIAPTSCEVMKMKAVNHKPMIRPEGTLALQGRGRGSVDLAGEYFAKFSTAIFHSSSVKRGSFELLSRKASVLSMQVPHLRHGLSPPA